MASLAGILKRKGYRVTGSDQNVYPPMSLFLASLGISVLDGYHPDNLFPAPDLVVVGNVITRNNPEAVELSRLLTPYLSLPQALKEFAFKDKRSIVISGTHGKTTTSALVAWILEKAGMDPGFMIGGIPQNFQSSFKLGQGGFFVIEGDEYDTAFFDKGPKFLHYNPSLAILTSIEFDHADIYRDLDHVIESFRKLIELIPPEGLLIANSDDPTAAKEIQKAKCPVDTYGLSGSGRWSAAGISIEEDKTSFAVLKEGEEYAKVTTSLYGRHNIGNILSALVLCHHLGIAPNTSSEAVGSFQGVKRRQELVGKKREIIVLDDFAHHPTSVSETVWAVRNRFKGHRVIAVFEPRSNSSRRNVFQAQYALSFDGADRIMIPEPPLMEKVPPGERFSSSRLVEDLRKRHLQAFYFPNTDQLLEELVKGCRTGDVVLFMSNGGFDNLPRRFFESLRG